MAEKIEFERMKFDRFEIPYKIWGKTGPYIVCVNGAQQSMGVWRSFISFFGEQYRIVVFDFPGQGRARIIKGKLGISFDEQISVLHEIVKVLSHQSDIYLFGASWGGIIIAGFISRYPKLVKKAILASFGVEPSPMMMQVIEEGQKLYHNGPGENVGELIINSFGQQIPEELKGKILHQFKTMSKEHFTAFYEHTKFVSSIRHIEDIIDLNKIETKTIIVNGENDTLLNPKDAKELSKLIPGSTFRMVKDAGHFLHFEQADIMKIYAEYFSA